MAEAAAAGVAVIVVTNGGSKKSTVTAAKYRNLGLDVTNQQVVSSRDALEARLARPQSEIRHLGVVDTWSTLPDLPGVKATVLTPADPAAWHDVDAIGLSGQHAGMMNGRPVLSLQLLPECLSWSPIPILPRRNPTGFRVSRGIGRCRHVPSGRGYAARMVWQTASAYFDQALGALEETTARTN